MLNQLRFKFEEIFSEEKHYKTEHPDDVIFNTIKKLDEIHYLPFSLVLPAHFVVNHTEFEGLRKESLMNIKVLESLLTNQFYHCRHQ
jgi:hypothetical protein